MSYHKLESDSYIKTTKVLSVSDGPDIPKDTVGKMLKPFIDGIAMAEFYIQVGDKEDAGIFPVQVEIEEDEVTEVRE